MSAEVATQRRNLPLLATTETCAGGTYIVTGANTGLGFEAAKHLVKLGAAKVVMGVRNVGAGEAARAEIEKEIGKTNVAEVWELDLASYESVKKFAKRAITELDRIDAVIENAAVAISQPAVAEGHILPLTVNVLSTFLLMVLLLPKMSESAQKFGILPHLVIVTSGASFDFEKDWDKIKDDPLVKMDAMEDDLMKTYPLSKLLEIMAIKHLATLLPISRTRIILNLVSPGLCRTDLSRNAPQTFREHLKTQLDQCGRTAEDGSRTLLHAAVAGKESHGCYLSSCEIAENRLPTWITDEEGKKSQKHVWNLVARELESIESGCIANILGE